MLTDLKLSCWSRPGIPKCCCSKDFRLRGLYLSQQKCICASRYVSRHMVPVSPCDNAEGFAFVEGPATNSVHCIHCHGCLQILLWQIRYSAYTCLLLLLLSCVNCHISRLVDASQIRVSSSRPVKPLSPFGGLCLVQSSMMCCTDWFGAPHSHSEVDFRPHLSLL